MYEPAAYAENGTPSDVFVFDDQTHIVRSSTTSSRVESARAGTRVGVYRRRLYSQPL